MKLGEGVEAAIHCAAMLAGVEGNDMDAMLERVVLQGQIDRIRRQLGQPKPVDLERRRAMTRERVRRHRAKQKE